jgi:methanogenic corrinoid protein MtbC1
VFAPVMHHIGRLWSDNRVTVAQEYVVATASQAHMARLYPRICAEAPRGPLLVAACVEGDLHEIGLRMVADLFQLDGWDVRFLGGDTPATVVAAFVDHVDADVVAISAMLATHVPQVVAQVALLRSGAGAARRRILVGGYPFKVDRTLWRRIGADGCGDDAPAALALARGWLGSQRPRLVGRV